MAKAILGIAIAVWLFLGTSFAVAQPTKNPSWAQLPAEQQRILAPIKGEWTTLDPLRKRKWIGIAQRYPKMSAEEQQRLQRRMREWVSLTPDQRRAARDKYREFELLPQEERQAIKQKWDEYKQELAERDRAEKERAAKEAAEAAEQKPPDSSMSASGTAPTPTAAQQ